MQILPQCHEPRLPPAGMNDNYDDDDDDDAMIDRYAEYDNEKPPEEFDDTFMDDDNEAVHSPDRSLPAKKSEDLPVPVATTLETYLNRPMSKFREEVDSDEDMDDITSVRQIAQHLGKLKKDLYKFER
jgi:hypothetical protein